MRTGPTSRWPAASEGVVYIRGRRAAVGGIGTPNRLVSETSPYLLQHAHNPVDWYPWGEEAFARARAEDKPLLLSIGYSACHWCHVMERESFEDQTTATLMNERFVSIKVDREERPDLDEVYMTAVQGLTGHGGWPMTVFLTPEGKPFYGGTYFPPTDRLGMPSFPRVLVSVSEAYRSQREQVLKQADLVTSFVRQQTLPSAPSDYLDATALDNAFVSLARGFDSVNGGFGGAPKFPQAMALEFLLRYHARTGNTEALGMADLTLQRMALGGIYDHLGGGFHRYAVDERWLVPHFEKMLYDNALLARAYLHAFQITGRPLYREVVEGTLGYVLREMRDPEGGLYSTQDADSDGREGAYYVWTPAEVEAVLGPGDARIACGFYGVTAAGNFEGHTILTRPPDPEARAAQLGIAPNDLDGVVDRARASLLTARLRRVAPARDDKVLCAWNGLMLRTLAEAHRVLGADPLPAEPERPPFGPTSGAHSTLLRRPATAYGAAAVENARFLLGRLLKGDRLFRVYKDGRVKVPGYLEDYAALADGLLALYEATFDVQWFAAAQRLTDSLIDLFWEQDAQSFSDTARDAEPLVARPKERWDNATPSGMSLACHALLRLWALTGESRLEQIARASLASMAEFLGPHAVGLGNLLGALDFYLGPPTQVAVIGDPNAAQTASLLGPLRASYLPNVVVACADPRDTEAPRVVPLLAERRPVDERPAAYVCEGFVCRLPCTDPEALEEALGIRRHSGGTEIP